MDSQTAAKVAELQRRATARLIDRSDLESPQGGSRALSLADLLDKLERWTLVKTGRANALHYARTRGAVVPLEVVLGPEPRVSVVDEVNANLGRYGSTPIVETVGQPLFPGQTLTGLPFDAVWIRPLPGFGAWPEGRFPPPGSYSAPVYRPASGARGRWSPVTDCLAVLLHWGWDRVLTHDDAHPPTSDGRGCITLDKTATSPTFSGLVTLDGGGTKTAWLCEAYRLWPLYWLRRFSRAVLDLRVTPTKAERTSDQSLIVFGAGNDGGNLPEVRSIGSGILGRISDEPGTVRALINLGNVDDLIERGGPILAELSAAGAHEVQAGILLDQGEPDRGELISYEARAVLSTGDVDAADYVGFAVPVGKRRRKVRLSLVRDSSVLTPSGTVYAVEAGDEADPFADVTSCAVSLGSLTSDEKQTFTVTPASQNVWIGVKDFGATDALKTVRVTVTDG